MRSMTRVKPPSGYETPSTRSRWLISEYMLGASFGDEPRNTAGYPRIWRSRVSRTVRFVRLSSGSISRRSSRAACARDVAAEHRAEALERRVEEVLLGEVVDLAGVVEVLGEAQRRALLDALEQVEVLVDARRHVERIGVPLAVDPVAGVELHEVELLVGRRAEHAEEVVEHLGHEVPRRPGVEPEAVALPAAGAAADLGVLLEQGHLVALAREQGRRGEPGDPPADDDRAGHAVPPRAAAAIAIRSFTGSGTRTRVRTSADAGVARMRRESSANRPCASATARRELRGRSGSVPGRERQLGVDVVEQRVLLGVGERRDVDAGEVAAPERLVIGPEVAQEVDLLERRAQRACAGLERRAARRRVYSRPGSRPASLRKIRRHISPTTSAEP